MKSPFQILPFRFLMGNPGLFPGPAGGGKAEPEAGPGAGPGSSHKSNHRKKKLTTGLYVSGGARNPSPES